MAKQIDRAKRLSCGRARAHSGATRWGLIALASAAPTLGCLLREGTDVDDGPRLGGVGQDAGVGEAGASGEATAGHTAACDGTPCGSVCADLSSDPWNCGACGHDCASGVCTAGACEAITLARGSFDSLAISGSYLYVIDVSTQPRVARLPSAGGPLEPISPVQSSGLYRIAADDAQLYGAIFITPTRSEFWSAPLTSGDFTLDAGGVLLGEARTSVALAVNATSLVSLEARRSGRTLVRDLTRFDKAANSPGGQVFATVDPVFMDVLALDEAAAFIVKGAEGPSEVVRAPLDGSGVSTVAEAPPGGTPVDLSVAGDQVFSASELGVAQSSTSGGETTLLSQEATSGVRADTDHVYYFTRGNPAHIVRVARGGGAPVRIGTEPQGSIGDVVQDADALYWLTGNGESIRRLDKD